MTLQAGIFLITFSGLMFEIALTRIFSATIWYHFAFVAISVALLGWGLGGFGLHLLKRWVRPSLDKAAVLCLLYGAALPFCLWLIVRNPFHPEKLAFYFAVSSIPFLLAGMALSMVFALHREIAGKLYFADLLGASTGALMITFLLSWLGGETAVLTLAFAPLLAAICFSRRILPAAALGVVLLAATFALEGGGAFRIQKAPTKGLYQHMEAQPGAQIALTGWNAYSRIDAVTGYPGILARLYIDSDAWTSLHRWDGKVESLESLRGWYRALPFRLVPNARTLVIGPGGGSDVLVALASGSPQVTAVEMNPLMLRFVRHYGATAGNIYDHPRVETILSEGRNFLSRTDRKFDVIFLGFVDSWAAVASGGLSLSENYLYTTEAFRAYYEHLSDEGVLVIMRWSADVPRLVTNSVALLGAKEAAPRVAVLLERRGTPEEPPQMIFMLRRQPFTQEQTAQIANDWGLAEPVIVPGRTVQPPYDMLLSGQKSLEQYEQESPERVDPVFDDRPFYFARQKPWGVPPRMMDALVAVLVPVVSLCVLLTLFGKPRGGRTSTYAASLLYFGSLGLGFIAVELALLQNLTLLLGHPIFTLSVLLFALLACGGIGSALSGRFAVGPVCLAVAGLGCVYAFGLPHWVPALLALPLWARIAIGIAFVAPLGFAMGMPFPSGLRRAGQGSLPAAPFYWGFNGVLSVVGSVGTMLVAVTLGFRVAMLAGSLCYLLAAATARSLETPAEADETAAREAA
jgi:predicted membrane-bound spermidine synthase